MKVELHLHTSRYSACSAVWPDEAMHALLAAGYEAVYLTEHHCVWPARELAALQREFPQLRIFPGVELNLTEDPLQHLLVLGTSDPAYLRIRRPAEVLRKAREEGRLTVLAHPCRWAGGAQMIEEGLLPDAIEFRTCNQDLYRSGEALALARRMSLPVVNAGDVHSLEMVGRYWIETARPLIRADDIRQIILSGGYENRPGPGTAEDYR